MEYPHTRKREEGWDRIALPEKEKQEASKREGLGKDLATLTES